MEPSSQSPAPSGKSTPQPPSGKSTPSSRCMPSSSLPYGSYVVEITTQEWNPFSASTVMCSWPRKRCGATWSVNPWPPKTCWRSSRPSAPGWAVSRRSTCWHRSWRGSTPSARTSTIKCTSTSPSSRQVSVEGVQMMEWMRDWKWISLG